MKKVVLIVIPFIVVCTVALVCLIHMISRSSYDSSSFSLEHEPDNIFVSSASDSLLVSIDGEIREYDPDGSYNILGINAKINSAYPDKGKVWFIDSNNGLYKYESSNSTLVLDDIKSFSIGAVGYAAVSSDGDIFFWNRNSETPLCVGNVPDADKIELGNGYVLVLNTWNQLYECVFPDDDRGSFEFSKIDRLELVEEICSGYGNIAVSRSGEAYYWVGSFGSERKIPYIDDPSDIERKCNELCLKKFSLTPAFCVGCSKNGEVYFWGKDFFRKSNNKSQKYVSSPERIRFITDSDDVFAGAHVIYIKSGTTFTAIDSV